MGLIYTDDSKGSEYAPFCKYYAKAFQAATLVSLANISTYIRSVTNESIAGFQTVLHSMKARARIIVVCLNGRDNQRNLMMAASRNKMIGPDYVYLFIQTSGSGFGKLF